MKKWHVRECEKIHRNLPNHRFIQIVLTRMLILISFKYRSSQIRIAIRELDY